MGVTLVEAPALALCLGPMAPRTFLEMEVELANPTAREPAEMAYHRYACSLVRVGVAATAAPTAQRSQT
jgi:hypothetical protein